VPVPSCRVRPIWWDLWWFRVAAVRISCANVLAHHIPRAVWCGVPRCVRGQTRLVHKLTPLLFCSTDRPVRCSHVPDEGLEKHTRHGRGATILGQGTSQSIASSSFFALPFLRSYYSIQIHTKLTTCPNSISPRMGSSRGVTARRRNPARSSLARTSCWDNGGVLVTPRTGRGFCLCRFCEIGNEMATPTPLVGRSDRPWSKPRRLEMLCCIIQQNNTDMSNWRQSPGAPRYALPVPA
jgi:hypothetical protein